MSLVEQMEGARALWLCMVETSLPESGVSDDGLLHPAAEMLAGNADSFLLSLVIEERPIETNEITMPVLLNTGFP